MGYVGCATLKELRSKAKVRAGYLGRIPREPRSRRVDHQGSAELPEGATRADMILVLDFGSQYTQLIARRVREARRLLRDSSVQRRRREDRRPGSRGHRFSRAGRRASTIPKRRSSTPRCSTAGPCSESATAWAFSASSAGAAWRAPSGASTDPPSVTIDDDRDLFAGLEGGRCQRVWMSHGDRMEAMPPGYGAIAHSANSPIAAFRDPARRRFGLQFHPEVAHTPRGTRGAARISSFASAAARPTGRWRDSSSARWRAHPRAGRAEAGSFARSRAESTRP